MIGISKLPQCVIWRNNTGVGWSGKSYAQGNNRVVVNAFPLRSGLCNGSSDLIGITQIEITPDMVGRKIGIFTAIETKTLKGKASIEQDRFINRVRELGGIAGIARNEEEALKLIYSAT